MHFAGHIELPQDQQNYVMSSIDKSTLSVVAELKSKPHSLQKPTFILSYIDFLTVNRNYKPARVSTPTSIKSRRRSEFFIRIPQFTLTIKINIA